MESQTQKCAPKEADRANAALPPVSQTQNTQERNQAELPMRLGLASKENGRSRTQSLTMHRAALACTSEGRAREASESPEGSAERIDEFSRRSVHRRVSPSLPAYMSPARSSLTPGCDILQRRLSGPSGLSATAERCETGAKREEQQWP